MELGSKYPILRSSTKSKLRQKFIIKAIKQFPTKKANNLRELRVESFDFFSRHQSSRNQNQIPPSKSSKHSDNSAAKFQSFPHLLREGTSSIRRIQYLIVKNREIQSQTQPDRVRRRQLRRRNFLKSKTLTKKKN